VEGCRGWHALYIVSRKGDFASRSDGSVRRRAPVNEPALRRWCLDAFRGGASGANPDQRAP